MRHPNRLIFGLLFVLCSPNLVSAFDPDWVEYMRASTASVHVMRINDTDVEITYGSQNCIGEFSGNITNHGSYLTAVDLNGAGFASECIFTIIPDGENAYRIEQGVGCTGYHGAFCELSGRVEKVATFSPSFDCSGALTGVEQSICSDKELSTLNVLLNEAFELASNNPNLASQRDWLAQRDACTDEICLRNLMGERIGELLHLAASSENILYNISVEIKEYGADEIFLGCRRHDPNNEELAYSELIFYSAKSLGVFYEVHIVQSDQFSEIVFGLSDWTASGNSGAFRFSSEPISTIPRRGYNVSKEYVTALSEGVVYFWEHSEDDENLIYFIILYFDGSGVSECFSP